VDPLTITLDGPGKNALSRALMASLREQLRAAGGRPVLLTGRGDALSAGLDLKEVLALDAASAPAFLAELEDMVRELFEYPGPTVACVNGHAVAGGAVLTLACDHRVAAADPKIRIGLNEVALGVRFPPVVVKLAAYRLPQRLRERVVLGAGLHDPRSAQEMGLVDEVADDVLAVATERLQALARHPADAYAAAKRQLRAGVLDVSPAERRRSDEEDLPTWTAGPLRAKIRAYLAR
jgi:Delta3-Delta2-enoyl-CoA isomerase